MQSITHLALDVQSPSAPIVAAAKQNDTLGRAIAASLFDGAAAFYPDSALAVIRYRKPDGTAGFYDTLEDDVTPAYSISGNVITFTLAEQMLTVAGDVLVDVNFYNGDGEKVTAFTFLLRVQADVLDDATIISSDYYNVLTATLAEAAAIAANLPAPSSDTPAPDSASGSAGTGNGFARGNHSHPINVATSGTPADLGTAARGSSAYYARFDHVHKKPTADDLSVVDIMCGTELTDGTNLNNLGFGVYHCQTAATAATLVNSPSSNNGFRLEVKQTIESSSRITQIAYLNDVQRIYYRNLTSVGWTSWILLAGTVTDTPTMAQNMGTLSTGSIRKSGNVVHLNMFVTGTTISTTEANLATIPSEYYPPTSVYGAAVIGVGPDVAYIQVTTAGNVQIRGGSAVSSTNIRLGMTWIIP
jgi:hypothetical protein